MNYRECYGEGIHILDEAEVPESKLCARLLLEYVCRTDQNTLLVHADREVTTDEYQLYIELIKKRAKRIPLQLLTNEQFFYGLPFYVNEHVLFPRQDTEILVEQALSFIKSDMNILDMCTGSGCIILSILSQRKGIHGFASDISEEALKVASINESSLRDKQLIKGNVTWIQGDLFEGICDIKEKFDMIVSNPPYIKSEDIKDLMPEVREHEPLSALDGKEDGLYFYRRIISEGKKYLKTDGRICFEIGYDQGQAVSTLLLDSGYTEVRVIKDYALLDRVVTAVKKGMD